MKCRVKVRDGPESVGLPDLEVECRVGGLEAQSALQTGVRLHGGVTRPKSVCEPFEGICDANTQGTETLAIALEGHFKGHGAVNEFVEEVTPLGGVGLRVCPSRCRHGRASINPPNDP